MQFVFRHLSQLNAERDIQLIYLNNLKAERQHASLDTNYI